MRTCTRNQVKAPDFASFKKVMLSEKYKPTVPEYAQSNEIYDAPTE